MKPLYSSKFLKISLEDGIMVQEWRKNPLDTEQFKQELINFLALFKIHKPRGVLWLQENFDLQIPEDIYRWIEKHILQPQYKSGLRKLAFTVPKKQQAHLSIIDSFNEVNSVLQPRYFTSREKALRYLNDHTEEASKSQLNYSINRSTHISEIVLELDYEQLPKAIKHIDKLDAQFDFNLKNQPHFNQLSLRELQIFKFICSGSSNKVIAKKLFLSESTIATHRKTIIKKLKIKSAKDWQNYADAFL